MKREIDSFKGDFCQFSVLCVENLHMERIIDIRPPVIYTQNKKLPVNDSESSLQNGIPARVILSGGASAPESKNLGAHAPARI